MSINNITRTNTVDEWRIQTNQSATEINKLETGDYTKTAGTLQFTGASNVIIGGTGTALQVTNTALFSTSVVVGKDISLGAQESATGNLGIGGAVTIYGSNVGLYVANTIVSNGNIIVKNTLLAANATINSNVVVVGTANIGYIGVANSAVIGKSATVGTTLDVTGNTTSGNLNTSGRVYTGTLTSTGRADLGATYVTSLDTGSGDATVGGKLTVTGDFVLTGDIVYDTDNLTVSTITPVTTTGAGYFGVFRGNTSGGVAGHNGLANSDANAYIRWSASANNWQIRDVFNSDSTTSYSKILTANLITVSTASVSNNDFASSWLMKNYVDNNRNDVNANTGAISIGLATEITDRQANVGAGLISVTNAYQANTGAINISLSNEVANRQANVGAARIADTASAQANVGAARIADTASAQANVGVGLIGVNNAWQANTGAINISLSNEVANRQANVGAARIADTSSITSAYQANAGIALISAKSYYTGTSPISVSAGAISIQAATSGQNGYMSSTYASKLDGIESGANNYSPPQSIGTGNSPTFAGLTINGAITASGDITAFYTSDQRLKDNLQPIENALSKVATLNGVTFSWNSNAEGKDLNVREAGVIAQQVQSVLPEVVTERDNGYLAVRYEKLVPLLIEAIKELNAKVEQLEKNK